MVRTLQGRIEKTERTAKFSDAFRCWVCGVTQPIKMKSKGKKCSVCFERKESGEKR